MNNNLLKEFLLKYPQHKKAVMALSQRVEIDFPLEFHRQDLIDTLNDRTMEILKKHDSGNFIANQLFGFTLPAFNQELLVTTQSNAPDSTEQCNTCKYKNLGTDQGHCYMFKDAPKEKCLKHTLV